MIDLLRNSPCLLSLRGVQAKRVSEVGDLFYRFGIKTMEIPIEEDGAYQMLVELNESMPKDCYIGARNVTTIEQLQRLSDMNIKMASSQHLDAELVEFAQDKGIFYIPGVATPSEAMQAA